MQSAANLIRIRFAQSDDRSAIERFNARMKAGGRDEKMSSSAHLFGETGEAAFSIPTTRRLMIAESQHEIRAGMVLYHHKMLVRGEERDFCWIHQPVSEGLVDRAYSLAIVQLMKKALSYQPFLLSLGVGSLKEAWAQFVLRLGWKQAAVPFLFYPVKVTNVLLGLTYLKQRPKLNLAARIGAYSGAGAGATGLLALRRYMLSDSSYKSFVESSFDEWADPIFADALADYEVTARRDSQTLNLLYPPANSRYKRIRVREESSGRDAGWIVVLATEMNNNKYFGNLKVGVLVDGFGRLTHVPRLIQAGINSLVDEGVDIVVANFSNAAWIRACKRAEFISAPSNYYLFASPGATPILQSCSLESLHLTRGDGDGMVHLRGRLRESVVTKPVEAD